MSSDLHFVAIDFETANRHYTSACAVGIAIVEGGAITQHFCRMIRPQPDFYTNSHIHGLTDRDTRQAPTFAQLWPELAEIVGDRILVAHNAGFDRSVMHRTLGFYGLGMPENPWQCTVRLSRKAFPQLHNHKLNTVAAHLGIPLNHHEAESDAIAAAHIALKAAPLLR